MHQLNSIIFSFQRNRLLFLPWLINSLISLFFNAITIAASFYTIFSQSKTPTIIPVGVAMILIFRKWKPKYKFHTKVYSKLVISCNYCKWCLSSIPWNSDQRFILSNFTVIYVYAYIAIYSLYLLIRRNSPNNEYSSLIEDRNGTGYPIYTRT